MERDVRGGRIAARAGDKPKSIKDCKHDKIRGDGGTACDVRAHKPLISSTASGSRHLSRGHIVLFRNAASIRLKIDATLIGEDLLITLVGGKKHVGAVALGGFATRSYASVLAVPNHRDDVIAKEAAWRISEQLRQSCVVVVGIHIDHASEGQIAELVDASHLLVDELIEALK